MQAREYFSGYIWDGTNGSLDLRNQAFQFAALCTLPVALSHDEIKVVQDLKEKFQEACHGRTILASSINVSSSFYLLLLILHSLRPIIHRSGSLN